MSEALEVAREHRNLIEKIAARVPGFSGYQERELRRAVDQRLRAELASRLDIARERINAHVARVPLTASSALARLSAAEKAVDAAARVIRHAGSGYAGFFDAFKIGDAELEQLYRFDLSLLDQVEKLGDAVSSLGEAGALERIEQALGELRGRVERRESTVRSALGERG